MITAAEFREKSEVELTQELHKLLRKQFKLRIKKVSDDEGVKPHLIRELRRDVARLKTILREKVGKKAPVKQGVAAKDKAPKKVAKPKKVAAAKSVTTTKSAAVPKKAAVKKKAAPKKAVGSKKGATSKD